MSTCATGRRGRPRSATFRLFRLAEILDEALADDANDAAEDLDAGPAGQLVGVAGSLRGDGGELALKPLDGHPAEVLLGFVAPSSWSALGVSTSGRARPIDTNAADDPSPAAGRVWITYLVSRSGASAAICRRPGDDVHRSWSNGLFDSPAGRIDDVLRRALLLPTHPPPSGPIDLWARLWLDAVMAAASADPDRPWSWPDVVELHPGVAIISEAAPELADEAIERVGRIGELQARARSWADLRSACAAGSWPVDGVPPPAAAWMDDGIFSRWVLDDLPECGDLVAALRDLIPSEAARRVAGTLSGWGLIPTDERLRH